MCPETSEGDGHLPPPGPAITVQISDDPLLLEELADQWDDLVADAAEPNPYLTQAWVRSWWEEFGAGVDAVPDPGLRLVALWRGPVLVAFLPLLELRVGGWPFHRRMLIGIGQENADYGGALVRAGDDEAARRLGRVVAEQLSGARVILNLTRLSPSGGFLKETESALRSSPYELSSHSEEPYPRLALRELGDDGTGLRRLAKSNDVPRRLRRLAETGEVDWVWSAPDPGGEPLAEFFRLHDLRWAGRTPSGPFVSAAGRRFVAAATRRFDGRQQMRLSFLRLDGVAIAARYGVVINGWYYGMKSAWDPEYARYGLGHLLTWHVLDQARTDGLEGFDFLRGADAHKSAWATDARTVRYYVVSAGGARGRVGRRMMWLSLRRRYRARESGSR